MASTHQLVSDNLGLVQAYLKDFADLFTLQRQYVLRRMFHSVQCLGLGKEVGLAVKRDHPFPDIECARNPATAKAMVFHSADTARSATMLMEKIQVIGEHSQAGYCTLFH